MWGLRTWWVDAVGTTRLTLHIASLPLIGGAVQRLADFNFPLRATQAQQLLKTLDALIDLGDRRSAALEQTEAFKGVQGPLK